MGPQRTPTFHPTLGEEGSDFTEAPELLGRMSLLLGVVWGLWLPLRLWAS